MFASQRRPPRGQPAKRCLDAVGEFATSQPGVQQLTTGSAVRGPGQTPSAGGRCPAPAARAGLAKGISLGGFIANVRFKLTRKAPTPDIERPDESPQETTLEPEEPLPARRLVHTTDMSGALIEVPSSLSPQTAALLVCLMLPAQAYHLLTPAPHGQLWMCFALLVVQASLVAMARPREQVTLSAHTLQVKRRTLVVTVPLADILDCRRVQRAGARLVWLGVDAFQGLLITLEDGTEREVGWGLSSTELEWLEETIHDAIAKREPDAQLGSANEIPRALVELVQR
ncbi:MAG: hypothetical protein ACI8S6_004836 [Myxococcota bacterium]|jgi:hypothetical protein